MAKYSIDGSTLTDVADAIRTQYGEDSPIAVTDMAEAILGIEGGGGDEFPLLIEIGEYTPTSDFRAYNSDQTTNPIVFEHSLGKIPFAFLLICNHPKNRSVNAMLAYVGTVTKNSSVESTPDARYGQAIMSNGSGGNMQNTAINCDVYTEDEIILFNSYGGTGVTVLNRGYFRTANTFTWIAIAEKGD